MGTTRIYHEYNNAIHRGGTSAKLYSQQARALFSDIQITYAFLHLYTRKLSKEKGTVYIKWTFSITQQTKTPTHKQKRIQHLS